MMEWSSKNKSQTHKSSLGEFISRRFTEISNECTFYNCRNLILDYIERQEDLNTAIVLAKIEPKRFLNNISFDLIYTTKNGAAFRSKDFCKSELPSGLLPLHIVDAISSGDSLNINFEQQDLEILNKEKDISIDEEESFTIVLEECKKNGVRKLILLDRVFYTRIECYGPTNDMLGVYHISLLKDLPKDLANKLYPGGQAEFCL